MGGKRGGTVGRSGSSIGSALTDREAGKLASVAEKKLTTRERKALEDYGGNGAQMINRLHREGIKDRALREHVQRKSDAVRDAIDSAPRLPKTTLYRRTDNPALLKKLEQGGGKGTVLTEKGFTSTSRRTGISDTVGGTGAIQMKINVKQGAKGVSMDKRGVAGEREVLLQRGSRFKVKSAKKVGGTWRVTVDLE